MPAGFVGHLPVGVSFIAGKWAEPRLIALAYAFEQATKVRVPPTFLPSTSTGSVSPARRAPSVRRPAAAWLR